MLSRTVFDEAEQQSWEYQKRMSQGTLNDRKIIASSRETGGRRTAESESEKQVHRLLISIITVVFNGARCLEECIESVVCQSGVSFEYVVIDGGSTDGTVDLLRKNSTRIDLWVSEPDRGIYDAMNKGLSSARGQWVLFLGADDRLCSESLKQVAGFLKDEKTIYYGNVRLLSSGRVFDGKFSRAKLMFHNISHQSIFYPRSVAVAMGYDIRYKSAADYELLLRTIATKRFSLQYMPILVANYNDVDGVSSLSEDPLFLRDRYRIIRRSFSRPYFLVYAARYHLVKLIKAARILAPLRRILNIGAK